MDNSMKKLSSETRTLACVPLIVETIQIFLHTSVPACAQLLHEPEGVNGTTWGDKEWHTFLESSLPLVKEYKLCDSICQSVIFHDFSRGWGE